MPVAERGVETEICESAATNVLLLRGHVGEDDATLRHPQFGRRGYHVCLAGGRESQQPEDTVGHLLEDGRPVLKGHGVDLVELVEVAEDDRILRETVLGPRGEREVGGQ